MISFTPPNSPQFRSGSAQDGNLDKSETSDMVSIENFEFFLDHVYGDVLSSYYFKTLNEQEKNAKNLNQIVSKPVDDGTDEKSSTKNFVNGNHGTDVKTAKSDQGIDANGSSNKGNSKQVNNILKINDENKRYDALNNIINSKLDEYKKKVKNYVLKSENLDDFKKFYFEKSEKLNKNEKIAKLITSNHNKSISKFLRLTVKNLNQDQSYKKWLIHLGQTILDMSQVYSDFKNSSQNKDINIKEKFHLLRYYYTEIIEKIKKKRSITFKGVWILHLLDDIFLRIFVWIDKKPNSNTDSVLLRNAFSHFNIVYDEQSLSDSGLAFEKIFLKNNSMAEFNDFKNSLKDVTWKNTLRIVFYNQKNEKSEADAMLDTNCYQVCRYFMTYCHCLFAIFSNELSHVPFSRTLLEEYESAYQLNVVESSINTSTKLALEIKKGCEIIIAQDHFITSDSESFKKLCEKLDTDPKYPITGFKKFILEEDLSVDQDGNFNIDVGKDFSEPGVVVGLTSFSDILVTSNGSVTVDDKELFKGNSIMIYGGKKLLIRGENGTNISYHNKSNYCSITISNGSIGIEYLKNDGPFKLLINKDGRLNISADVEVNGEGNEFSINTIGKSGTLSFKQFIQIAGKNISLSAPKQENYSNFESSGNLTLVSNESAKAIKYQSLTIESKKGTIMATVTNNREPKNFIKIYSHKTKHMIKKMNEKLGMENILLLHTSEVSILKSKIKELELQIKKLETVQGSTNQNKTKIPCVFDKE